MKMILTLVFLFCATSCQDFNSHTFDDQMSLEDEIDTSTPAGERLSNAYKVMKNKCMNCHTGAHSEWSAYTSDEQWIQSGKVIPGETSQSEIHESLINAGGTMPKNGTALSAADYQAIVNWIEGM